MFSQLEWLYQLLLVPRTRVESVDLKLQAFKHPLDIRSRIRGEYLYAHLYCRTCMQRIERKVQNIVRSSKLERKLTRAPGARRL
jgi:hypothetical protein